MAFPRTASPGTARRGPLWAAWLWLLLATIGAHATLPVGSPIARGNGSAFSAATVDVALAPRRKATSGETTAQQRQPEAEAGRAAGPDPDLPFLATPPVVLSAPWQQPGAGPPHPAARARAESFSARAYRARAPPIA